MRDELQKKETTNSEKKAGTSLSLSFSISLPVLFCCEAGTSLSLSFLYWSLSLCGLSTGLSSHYNYEYNGYRTMNKQINSINGYNGCVLVKVQVEFYDFSA